MSSPPPGSPNAPEPAWQRVASWIVRGFILAFLWAMLVEPELVFRHDRPFQPDPIHASQWPAACRGMRIAVVSDFHIGDPHLHALRLAYIRRQVAQARLDLILVPGDFAAHVLGGRTLPMTEISRRLQEWPKIAPVLAVLGNHDYSDAPADVVIRGLERHGIDVLSNESRAVSLRGGACRFWVAGTGDGFSGLDSLPASLENVPPKAPTILLTHDARVALKVKNPARITLIVAGHTHGGVACVPGTKWCLTRIHRWTGGWVRGWYRPPGSPAVLVSSGLGNSIFPGRFGSPPGWDLVEWE